jgi:Ca2+-binding EF-hand superfamily protein
VLKNKSKGIMTQMRELLRSLSTQQGDVLQTFRTIMSDIDQCDKKAVTVKQLLASSEEEQTKAAEAEDFEKADSLNGVMDALKITLEELRTSGDGLRVAAIELQSRYLLDREACTKSLTQVSSEVLAVRAKLDEEVSRFGVLI